MQTVNCVEDFGAIALSQALKKNTSLTKLYLSSFDSVYGPNNQDCSDIWLVLNT